MNSHKQQGTGQAAAGVVPASRPWVSVSPLFPNLSQEHFLRALSVLEKAAAGYRASSISVPNLALCMGLHILVCVRTAWRNASSARNVNLLMSGYMTRRSQTVVRPARHAHQGIKTVRLRDGLFLSLQFWK